MIAQREREYPHAERGSCDSSFPRPLLLLIIIDSNALGKSTRRNKKESEESKAEGYFTLPPPLK